MVNVVVQFKVYIVRWIDDIVMCVFEKCVRM